MGSQRPGSGTETLIGLKIESPSDLRNVGHPMPEILEVASPAGAPTATEGDAGAITGTLVFVMAHFKQGLPSGRSPVSAPITVTGHKIDLADLEVSADPGVDERRVWASHQGGAAGTWYWAFSLWDNTATTFTGYNLATDSPFRSTSNQPPTQNLTGKNFGYRFYQAESADYKPDRSMIATKALTGLPGMARQLPGESKFDHTTKLPVSTSAFQAFMTARNGRPTITYAEGGAVKILDWKVSYARRYSRSIELVVYKGGATGAEHFVNVLVGDLALSVAGGKHVEGTAKLVGCGGSFAGWGIPDPANTGTYKSVPVVKGYRMDAARAVPLKLAVSTAYDSGTHLIGFKAYTTSAGGSGTEIFFKLDPTSHKQTSDGMPQYSDWAEAIDENGLRIGADIGSNRSPFDVLWPTIPGVTDPRDLLVGDKFTIPVQEYPAGIGTGRLFTIASNLALATKTVTVTANGHAVTLTAVSGSSSAHQFTVGTDSTAAQLAVTATNLAAAILAETVLAPISATASGAVVSVSKMPPLVLATGTAGVLVAAENDDTFTGFAPLMLLTSVFTAAHLTFRYGPAAADVILDIQDWALNLSGPIDPVFSLGAEAMTPTDVDRLGEEAAKITVKRRHINRDFEIAVMDDRRFYGESKLEGEPIQIQPGVFSTYRDSIIFTTPQLAPKTKSPVSGPKVIPEDIELTAEQPDDRTLDVLSVRMICRELLPHPA
jgi:hypothetical protein